MKAPTMDLQLILSCVVPFKTRGRHKKSFYKKDFIIGLNEVVSCSVLLINLRPAQ